MNARSLILTSLALAVALGATSPATATTWNGNGSNSILSNGANWQGNIAPSNNGAGTFWFAGNQKPTPYAAGPWSINQIIFGNIGQSFSLAGYQLAIYGSITNDSNYHCYISNSIVLANYLPIYANNEDITLSGSINQTGNSLSARGNSVTILGGNVSNGTLRTDGGTLQVEGTNSSDMELDGGTLIVASNEPWGSGSANPTATVETTSEVQAPGTVVTPNHLFDMVGGDLNLNVSGDYTFGGFASVGIGRNLVKSGSGIARMGKGTAGFLGSIDISRGTLSLEGSPSGGYHWGPIVIGDGVGGPDADVLQTNDPSSLYLSTIVVNSSGLLQMNGTEDTIHDVTLQGGRINGSDMVLDRIATLYTPETARIDGVWSAHSDTIEVDVAPGNFDVDVEIGAAIIGDSSKLFLKEGNGIASLTQGNFGQYFETHVDNGTLVLAAPFAPILNTISAGDGISNGASSDAVIKLGADNQIAGQDVVLNIAGSMKVEEFEDTIGNIRTESGQVTIGFYGKLTLNGDWTTTGASFVPGFSGGTLELPAGPHVFDIADGFFLHDAGMLSNVTGPGSVIKQGLGQLRVWRNSSYTGGTEIAAGSISIPTNAGFALGHETVTVKPGATLVVEPAGKMSVRGLDCQTDSSLDLQGGTFTATGGTAAFSSGEFAYGAATASGATVVITDGCDATVLTKFSIAQDAGTKGSADVLGGDSSLARTTLRNTLDTNISDLVVGDGGEGSLTIQNGALVDFTDQAIVAREPGSIGSILVSGMQDDLPATLRADGGLYIGGFLQPGGSAEVEVMAGGLLDLPAGILIHPAGLLRQTGGEIRALSLVISTGATEFLGGTLSTAYVTGNLITGGSELAPGPMGGTTIIDGDYGVSTGSLKIELGGLVPETQHDKVSVGRATNLSGTLNLALKDGHMPTVGDTYTILTGSPIVGEFETVNVPVLTEGQLYVEYLTNAVRVVVRSASSVTDTPFIPDSFALAQNAPNPFNPSTMISFDLPDAAQVTLDVYDLAGRRVARLADGIWAAGRHSVRWPGTDDNGRAVASGMYAYVFQAAEYREVRRMMLVK